MHHSSENGTTQQRPSVTFQPLSTANANSGATPQLLQLTEVVVQPTSQAPEANATSATVAQPTRGSSSEAQPASKDDAEKAEATNKLIKGEDSMKMTSFLCVGGWAAVVFCIATSLWTFVVIPLLFTFLVLWRRLYVGFEIERYHGKHDVAKCLIDWPRDLWDFMVQAAVMLFVLVVCILESIFKCLRCLCGGCPC